MKTPDPRWTLSQVRASGCQLSPLFALLLGVPADSPRIVKPEAPPYRPDHDLIGYMEQGQKGGTQ